MKRIACFATVAALVTSYDALAVGAIANVTIVDRDSGVTLSTHFFHGEYWVAGTPGARYAIEIRNCIGGRLLAVTSVDGVNVLSGATAGWDQAGYVFNPGERYQITGWRKTNAEVAAFTFTESPNSYAERTRRPANVGRAPATTQRPLPARARPSHADPGSIEAKGGLAVARRPGHARRRRRDRRSLALAEERHQAPRADQVLRPPHRQGHRAHQAGNATPRGTARLPGSPRRPASAASLRPRPPQIADRTADGPRRRSARR